MRSMFHGICVVATLFSLTVSSGCVPPTASNDSPIEMSGPPPATGGNDDHSGHDHAAEHEGPHGGHVIEMGRNHEYHAELVENELASSVTVYVLDTDMKELAIDQPSIVMNLVVDGQGKSFELTANGSTNGIASRFDATDKTLFEALHVHEATGKLRITINGTPFSGEVEHHDHHDDHDDHGHDDGHKH